MLKELDEMAAKILNLIIIHLISIAVYISIFICMVMIIGLSPSNQNLYSEPYYGLPTLSDIPKYKIIFDITSKFWSDVRS